MLRALIIQLFKLAKKLICYNTYKYKKMKTTILLLLIIFTISASFEINVKVDNQGMRAIANLQRSDLTCYSDGANCIFDADCCCNHCRYRWDGPPICVPLNE